jgi:hypothetical protein
MKGPPGELRSSRDSTKPSLIPRTSIPKETDTGPTTDDQRVPSSSLFYTNVHLLINHSFFNPLAFHFQLTSEGEFGDVDEEEEEYE